MVLASAQTHQDHFRIRNDDGSETTATWKANEDTNPSAQSTGVNIRSRLTVSYRGGTVGIQTDVAGQLQYNKNSAGWNNVTGSSSVIKASASSNFADEDFTTNQLTLPSGTAFVQGRMDENDGTTSTVNLQSGGFSTEFEHCWQIVNADVANADTIQLRISGLNTYDQTPTITVSKASGNSNFFPFLLYN